MRDDQENRWVVMSARRRLAASQAKNVAAGPASLGSLDSIAASWKRLDRARVDFTIFNHRHRPIGPELRPPGAWQDAAAACSSEKASQVAFGDPVISSAALEDLMGEGGQTWDPPEQRNGLAQKPVLPGGATTGMNPPAVRRARLPRVGQSGQIGAAAASNLEHNKTARRRPAASPQPIYEKLEAELQMSDENRSWIVQRAETRFHSAQLALVQADEALAVAQIRVEEANALLERPRPTAIIYGNDGD
jgi:hypothetical protein